MGIFEGLGKFIILIFILGIIIGGPVWKLFEYIAAHLIIKWI